MRPQPLTPTQAKLLDFLKLRTAAGSVPTISEMREHLNLASKSGVVRLLDVLATKGYIQRKFGMTRSILLVGDEAYLAAADAIREWTRTNYGTVIAAQDSAAIAGILKIHL